MPALFRQLRVARMPTQYSDQFYYIDPGFPPAAGTTVTVVTENFTDVDDNGFIGTATGDTFVGSEVTAVWEGDTLTINVAGTGDVTYTGVTFYDAAGNAVFTPTDGQQLQDGTFVSSTFVTTSTNVQVSTLAPICFTPGTLIDTPGGRRPAEDIRAGDIVTTLDRGPQQVIWTGRQTLEASGDNAPIRFLKGAVGNSETFQVSPQHRMLISGWRAELHFGTDEVLVAARHLVNGDTIHVNAGGQVTYIHIMFDRHEIITGAGVPSESYFPGHAVKPVGRVGAGRVVGSGAENRLTDRSMPLLARPAPPGALAAALRL